MRSRVFLPVVAVLFAAATVPASAQIPTLLAPRKSALSTVEIIEDLVPNTTTVTVYTVPAGVRLVITDLIVSNNNAEKAGSQRIYRGPVEVTSFMTVPAVSTFSHSFVSGLQFKAGEVVRVRNGASAGPISFSLYGYLVPTKTP